MTERQFAPQSIAEKYIKTTRAIAKTRRVIRQKDKELLGLDQSKGDYSKTVRKIVKVKYCLRVHALHTLTDRERELEERIIFRSESQALRANSGPSVATAKLDKGLRDLVIPEELKKKIEATGKKQFGIFDVAEVGEIERYESVVPDRKLLRQAAQELGIACAWDSKPHFSQTDTAKIIVRYRQLKSKEPPIPDPVDDQPTPTGWVEDKDGNVFVCGKRIDLSQYTLKEIKALKALFDATKENPIDIPTMAKKMYGEKFLPADARSRVTSVLSYLPVKLHRDGVNLIGKPWDGKGWGEKWHPGTKNYYYLTAKIDGHEPETTETFVVHPQIVARKDVGNGGNGHELSETPTDVFRKEVVPSDLLSDEDILVLVRGLSSLPLSEEGKEILKSYNVRTRFLESPDLVNSTMKTGEELDRKQVRASLFDKGKLDLLQRKLIIFTNNRPEFLEKSSGESRLLLACFGQVEAGKMGELIDKIIYAALPPYQRPAIPPRNNHSGVTVQSV